MTCFCAWGEARNELLCLVADPTFKENLASTVEDLLAMNVVPVFNENDAISKGVGKATVRHPVIQSSSHLLYCNQLSCCAVL